jgi:hypothetical protein
MRFLYVQLHFPDVHVHFVDVQQGTRALHRHVVDVQLRFMYVHLRFANAHLHCLGGSWRIPRHPCARFPGAFAIVWRTFPALRETCAAHTLQFRNAVQAQVGASETLQLLHADAACSGVSCVLGSQACARSWDASAIAFATFAAQRGMCAAYTL